MNLVDKKFSEYLKTLKDQAAAGFLREVVFNLPEEERRAAIIKHLPEMSGDTVDAIIKRKENNIDCTEEESAEIKHHIKQLLSHPQDTEGLKKMEELFPCEFSEVIEGRNEAVHKAHCTEDACKYGDDDCPVEAKDRIWTVPVLRTGYATKTIDVIAKTEQEAIDKAIDEAGGKEFSENNAEYSAPDGAF